jgi:hypothetical protein
MTVTNEIQIHEEINNRLYSRTLATTKQQSKNARTEMTPLSFQKHNLVTLKRDAL